MSQKVKLMCSELERNTFEKLFYFNNSVVDIERKINKLGDYLADQYIFTLYHYLEN